MASMNKVQLIGRLGRDPEIRSTQAGKSIGNLNLATTETWNDRNSGEKQERTEWHRVTIMADGLAEVCGKHLQKGDSVYVEGKLQTRKWTDQQGQDRYTTEIVVSPFDGKVLMLDVKKWREARESGGSSNGNGGGNARQPAQQSANNNRQSGTWGDSNAWGNGSGNGSTGKATGNGAAPKGNSAWAPTHSPDGDLDDEIPF